MSKLWVVSALLLLGRAAVASPIVVAGSGSFSCGWDWRTAPYGTPYTATVSFSFEGQDRSGNPLSGNVEISDVLQSGQSCGAFVPSLQVSMTPFASTTGLFWGVTLNYLDTQYTSTPSANLVHGYGTTSNSEVGLDITAGGTILDLQGLVSYTNATATQSEVIFRGQDQGAYGFSSGTFEIDDSPSAMDVPEPGTLSFLAVALIVAWLGVYLRNRGGQPEESKL